MRLDTAGPLVTTFGEVTALSRLRVTPGVTTFLGVASLTSAQVVVRRVSLRAAQPWNTSWLVRDLGVLAGLGSPHLVPTRVVDVDSSDVLLVREFVPGWNLREWALQQPFSAEPCTALFRQLFTALGELHEQGIVHGGVHTDNVLVSADGTSLLLTDALVNRALLAAPDQAGALSETVRPAAGAGGFADDLRSAGWLLLQCLSASSSHAGKLLGQGPASPPTREEVTQLVESVELPPGYRDILVRLLHPAGEYGYGRAQDVVAALDELGSSDNAGRWSDEADPALLSARARLLYLNPALVGRDAELERLDGHLERSASGAAVVVCLTGEAGVGKTRLLDAVVSRAEGRAFQVVQDRAFHHTAQRPLGLFSGVFAALVDLLREHPEVADRIHDELGHLLRPIVALLPELRQAFPGCPVDEDSNWTGDAVVAAAARLFSRVFAHLGPGLVVLDDCQWADATSLELLAKISAGVSAQTDALTNVTLLCSFRADTTAEIACLGPEIEIVQLKALSRRQSEELVGAVAGEIADDLADYVLDYSRGNPLKVLTILRALVDSSRVRQEQEQWVFAEDASGDLPVLPWESASEPHRSRKWRSYRGFLAARIDGLPAETVQALCQAAVLGHRFAVPTLVSALGLDSTQVQMRLGPAIARGVLERPSGTPDDLQFTHDHLRDAVLESCEPHQSSLHARAAAVLSNGPAPLDDYEIAYHYDKAGDPASAAPYALRAAEAALKQNSLDLAYTNFLIAQAGIERPARPDASTRMRVLQGLGTVHMLRGNYEFAQAELSAAYEIAEGLAELESLRIAVLLEELAFKDGRIEDAEVWRERVARGLGLRFPKAKAAVWAALLVEVVRLLVAPLGRRAAGRVGPDTRLRDQLKAQLYTRLMFEYWFSQPRMRLALVSLRGIRISRRSTSITGKAQMYAAAAVILAGYMPPLSRVALKLADRAWRWREEAQDGWGLAQSHHFRGFVLHCGGRYDEAIESFDKAVDAFSIMGDRWEELAARWQKALCLYRQGHLHEAGALARETYHAAARIGDRIAAGTALAVWTRCLPNEVSSDLINRELSLIAPADGHTRALLSGAAGWRSFIEGRSAEALDSLTSATQEHRRAGIHNHFVAPLATWRLHILRHWSDCAPGWSPNERRRRRRAARRQLRRSLLTAAVFQAERPAVLREWAILSFAQGRRRRGRWLLSRAIRSARHTGCAGEVAACLFVAASVRKAARQERSFPAVETELCRRLRIRVDRGIVEASTLQPEPVVVGNSTMRQEFPESIRRIVSAAGRDDILKELRAATHLLTPALAVLFSHGASTDGMAEGRGPSVIGSPELVAVPVEAFGIAVADMVVEFPRGKARDFAMTVEVLAGLAGAALEREQLRKDSIERIVAVQEAERGRIARDLHDEFGSLFTGILDAAATLEKQPEDAARRVGVGVRKLATDGVHAVRSMAWGLRPAGLEHFGLVGCVEQYVEDCEQRSGIRIQVSTDGDAWSTLPTDLAIGLFRIIQEALTNITRHSGATEASVLLVASQEVLRAVIEDNGSGFILDGFDEEPSLGISGMRERARLLGGRLRLETEPGLGTTVLVEVPRRP
jgi:two-component system sensor kinase